MHLAFLVLQYVPAQHRITIVPTSIHINRLDRSQLDRTSYSSGYPGDLSSH